MLQVVKQFLPKTAAIAKWPTNQKGATEFALQYGDLDELAPPKLAKELIQDLRAGGLSIPVSSPSNPPACVLFSPF